jgi:microsomal dipeptidase-like Zn-dependent dipeptidase
VEISERFCGDKLGSTSSPHVTQLLLHVSMSSAITAELLRRGWTEADARKVLGGNALRALRDAEELAEA